MQTKGNIKLRFYLKYFKYGGLYFIVITFFSFCMAQVALLASDIWISYWSQDTLSLNTVEYIGKDFLNLILRVLLDHHSLYRHLQLPPKLLVWRLQPKSHQQFVQKHAT